MIHIAKKVWLTLMVVLVLFCIGILYISTAEFNRWVSIDGFFNCMVYLIPAVLILILSGRAYLQNMVTNGASLTNIVTWCYLILIVLAFLLYFMVANQSYLDDRISAEQTQVTSDGKYEYRLEFVNPFQRRAKARLYLKEIENGEENYIEIDLDASKVGSLSYGKNVHWTKLQPTDNPNIYILEVEIMENGGTFDINIEEKSASEHE